MLLEDRLSDVLSEFARTLATDFPIQGILDHLVERIVDVLPISAAGVTLISPTTNPRFIAASDESAMRFEQLQTELGEGPCLAAFQTDAPIAIPDLAKDLRFAEFTRLALAEGLAAVFTFPLRDGDRCLGALDLYRTMAGSLDESEMAAAQTLADVATAYLLNAQARDDLKVASASARHTAMHDGLTGLANRTLLVTRLEHAVSRTRRSGTCVGVLFADLDRFKRVNDTFGHHVGDELLVSVARRLSLLFRPGDTVARLAGDEFVMICEDMDDPSRGPLVAARVKEALEQPFKLSSTEVRTTASVGIAVSTLRSGPGQGSAQAQGSFTSGGVQVAEQLLRQADAAMYQIKRGGGDGFGVVDLERLHESDQRLNLSEDLRRAHGRGELRLEYQPIVSTADQRLTGAEALLRWSHRSLGPVDPAVFITLAEHSGLIVDIGRTVLDQACLELSRWHAPDGVQLGVAINVSPLQLISSTFVPYVKQTLEEAGVHSERVTLEVTEGALIQDRHRALIVLDALREIGVQIALDDFGTGSSSLSNLRDFPVDIVKIDRSFVGDLGLSSQSMHIVEAVVTLAHRLGMRTVAEGVETEGQYQSVLALGCDFYQGNHFSPSLPAASFREFGSPAPELSWADR
ncbi:MAG: sensor domain-containing phosphodiesterase [Marmoricola sp.]